MKEKTAMNKTNGESVTQDVSVFFINGRSWF